MRRSWDEIQSRRCQPLEGLGSAVNSPSGFRVEPASLNPECILDALRTQKTRLVATKWLSCRFSMRFVFFRVLSTMHSLLGNYCPSPYLCSSVMTCHTSRKNCKSNIQYPFWVTSGGSLLVDEARGVVGKLGVLNSPGEGGENYLPGMGPKKELAYSLVRVTSRGGRRRVYICPR